MPRSSPSPTRTTASAGSPRRPFLVAGVVVLTAALVGGLATYQLVQRWQATDRAGTTGEEAGRQPGVPTAGQVTLFYVAPDGRGLVERRVDLAQGGDLRSRARAIVERQLDVAPAPFVSAFPVGTRLRSIYLAPDGNAFVDLSGEVTEHHSGGSLDELFTVYALVNALTINMPEIAAVQIIIDGAEVDTLSGHIDLRQPLAPSLKWVVGGRAEPATEADATSRQPAPAPRDAQD